jgi:ABC-type phosphate transport system permease subunit
MGLPGMRLRREFEERSVEAVLFFSAIASIFVMLLIFYFLIHESLRAFAELGLIPLLFGQKWHSAGDIYGMMPLIVDSLIITILALFINILIGFPLAIYLAELATSRCSLHSLRFFGRYHSGFISAGAVGHAHGPIHPGGSNFARNNVHPIPYNHL